MPSCRSVFPADPHSGARPQHRGRDPDCRGTERTLSPVLRAALGNAPRPLPRGLRRPWPHCQASARALRGNRLRRSRAKCGRCPLPRRSDSHAAPPLLGAVAQSPFDVWTIEGIRRANRLKFYVAACPRQSATDIVKKQNVTSCGCPACRKSCRMLSGPRSDAGPLDQDERRD